MKKTALIIVGTLLIAGSVMQTATASERHEHLRRAYNQLNGPVNTTVQPQEWRRDIQDPSRPGGEDPSFNPAG
jgi:hypothetical protein